MNPEREMIQAKLLALMEQLANSILSPSHGAYADDRHLTIHCGETANDCLCGNVQAETLWPDLIENALGKLSWLSRRTGITENPLHEVDVLLDAVSSAAWKTLNWLIDEQCALPSSYEGNPALGYETKVLALALFLGDACPPDLALLAQLLEGAYSSGGLPCGWTGGEFPLGRMIVYQPLRGIAVGDDLEDPRRWVIQRTTTTSLDLMCDRAFGLDFQRLDDSRWLILHSERDLKPSNDHEIGIVFQGPDRTFLQANGHRVPLQEDWRRWGRSIRYVMPQISCGSRWSEIQIHGDSPVTSRSDAAYRLVFNLSASDQWEVVENGSSASGHLLAPMGTILSRNDQWLYQDGTSGTIESLPADWRKWAKAIREKRP